MILSTLSISSHGFVLGFPKKPRTNGASLHNGMILSTLSISSHGFALGFLKRPRTNGISITQL